MKDINTIFFEGDKLLNPVIFIHGDLQNHTALNFIVNLMKSKNHPCLSFDIPGHGLSKLSKQTGNVIKVLKQITKERKIENPIIVGYSIGTAIASIYAQEIKASGMILISPLISNFKTANPAINYGKIGKKFIKQSIKSFKGQKLIDYSDKNKSSKDLQTLGFETTETKGLANNIKIVQSLPTQDSIQNFDFPILLITSGDDPLIPIQYIRNLQKKAKLARLEIITGGHNTPTTNPHGIIDVINKNYEFISGQKA